MVRNTATNKFYSLTSPLPNGVLTPAWEASVEYGNTGNALVRYNSNSLFGGLVGRVGPTTSAITPPKVPAGLYQVYIDESILYYGGPSASPTKYLTTSLTPFVPVQLL